MRYKTFLSLCVLVCCLLGTVPAAAQTNATAPQSDFHWTVAPYAWLTGLYGTVGAKGFDTSVDASFADLSKYLNMAAMVHLEGIYGDRAGLFTDFNYALLGDQASGKRVSLDGKTSLILTDIAAFYRVGRFPLGQAGNADVTFDLLGGVRIWNLALKLNGDSARGGRDVYASRTWADPIVGARAEFHFAKSWLLSLRGGVGGFSVSSTLTWDTTAALGYTFWEHGTVLVGYRAVGDNYNTGSGRSAFKFDATLSGPILGVAFTF